MIRGCDQSNGEQNDLNKGIGIQRTGTEQQTADGKNRHHGRWENGHGKAEIDIASPHPFHITACTLFGRDHEFLIGALCLGKRLDDLNAVDILYRSIIEYLGFIHGVLIAFRIATGHSCIAPESDGHCYQHSQSHTPIQYKEIHQQGNRHQQV